MQIVIKIPEVFYEALRKTDRILGGQRSGKTLMSVIYNAVAKGTPLPKGHGRLIDEKDLSLMTVHMIDGMFVCDAPTIIEADKENEDA